MGWKGSIKLLSKYVLCIVYIRLWIYYAAGHNNHIILENCQVKILIQVEMCFYLSTAFRTLRLKSMQTGTTTSTRISRDRRLTILVAVMVGNRAFNC